MRGDHADHRVDEDGADAPDQDLEAEQARPALRRQDRDARERRDHGGPAGESERRAAEQDQIEVVEHCGEGAEHGEGDQAGQVDRSVAETVHQPSGQRCAQRQ